MSGSTQCPIFPGSITQYMSVLSLVFAHCDSAFSLRRSWALGPMRMLSTDPDSLALAQILASAISEDVLPRDALRRSAYAAKVLLAAITDGLAAAPQAVSLRIRLSELV